MKIKYGENIFDVADNASIDEVQEGLKVIYPEIGNANAVETEDGYEFVVQAGTKGSELTVIYGGSNFQVPGNLSDNEIKEAASIIFPEVSNATVIREGDTVRLAVQAGTKGV